MILKNLRFYESNYPDKRRKKIMMLDNIYRIYQNQNFQY